MTPRQSVGCTPPGTRRIQLAPRRPRASLTPLLCTSWLLSVQRSSYHPFIQDPAAAKALGHYVRLSAELHEVHVGPFCGTSALLHYKILLHDRWGVRNSQSMTLTTLPTVRNATCLASPMPQIGTTQGRRGTQHRFLGVNTDMQSMQPLWDVPGMPLRSTGRFLTCLVCILVDSALACAADHSENFGFTVIPAFCETAQAPDSGVQALGSILTASACILTLSAGFWGTSVLQPVTAVLAAVVLQVYLCRYGE